MTRSTYSIRADFAIRSCNIARRSLRIWYVNAAINNSVGNMDSARAELSRQRLRQDAAPGLSCRNYGPVY